MGLDQIAIALLGATAAWASQARRLGLRRWACIFGLLGQPFWFYASWQARAMGHLCRVRGLHGRLAARPVGVLAGARTRRTRA